MLYNEIISHIINIEKLIKYIDILLIYQIVFTHLLIYTIIIHIYENIGHVLPVILSLCYEHKVSTHYIKYIITMYYY